MKKGQIGSKTLANVLVRMERYTQVTDGCWYWTGTLDKDGYGVLTVLGKKKKAHRLAWQHAQHLNLLPENKVCHRCDNPRCVRPSHLFLGTQADNIRDMVSKDRGAIKLTKRQVLEIRAKYSSGLYTLEDLGLQYEVTFQHISALFHKIKRKDVA